MLTTIKIGKTERVVRANLVNNRALGTDSRAEGCPILKRWMAEQSSEAMLGIGSKGWNLFRVKR